MDSVLQFFPSLQGERQGSVEGVGACKKLDGSGGGHPEPVTRSIERGVAELSKAEEFKFCSGCQTDLPVGRFYEIKEKGRTKGRLEKYCHACKRGKRNMGALARVPASQSASDILGANSGEESPVTVAGDDCASIRPAASSPALVIAQSANDQDQSYKQYAKADGTIQTFTKLEFERFCDSIRFLENAGRRCRGQNPLLG